MIARQKDEPTHELKWYYLLKRVWGVVRLPEGWRIFAANRPAMIGLFMLVGLMAAAFLGPFVVSDPVKVALAESLQPPSLSHPLGTDDSGRDQLARIVFGMRYSILVAASGTTMALIIGIVLGLTAGYFGGWLDDLLMRILDIFFAFPLMLLALLIVTVMGKNVSNLIFTIGLIFAPGMARVVRAPVLSIKEKEFVEAARALGVSNLSIMFSHILPNAFAPVLVQVTLNLGTAIITEAGLSFLGLGSRPPDPSLGTMIVLARRFMNMAPWLALCPGIAIAMLVLAFNLVGDGLRDVLDPHMREMLTGWGTEEKGLLRRMLSRR